MSENIRESLTVGPSDLVFSGDKVIARILEILGAGKILANNPYVIDCVSSEVIQDVQLERDYTQSEIDEIVEKIRNNGALPKEKSQEAGEQKDPKGTEYRELSIEKRKGRQYPDIKIQELRAVSDRIESEKSICFMSIGEGKIKEFKTVKTRRGESLDEDTIVNSTVDKYGIVQERYMVERAEDGSIAIRKITRDTENPMIAIMYSNEKGVEYYPIDPLMMQDVLTPISLCEGEKTMEYVMFKTREEAIEFWKNKGLSGKIPQELLSGRYGEGLKCMLDRLGINISTGQEIK